MKQMQKNNPLNRLRRKAIRLLGGMDRYSIELPDEPVHRFMDVDRRHPVTLQAETCVGLLGRKRNRELQLENAREELLLRIARDLVKSNAVEIDERAGSDSRRALLRARVIVLLRDGDVSKMDTGGKERYDGRENG